MKKFFNGLMRVLGRYKYLIVVIVGVLWVSLLDENSWRRRVQLQGEIDALTEEYQEYARQNAADSVLLDNLKRNPKAYERVARERYFMKADDEDVFVLSDDE